MINLCGTEVISSSALRYPTGTVRTVLSLIEKEKEKRVHL